MLFLSTTRVILETEASPKPASALDVTVIGHQFWWEYRYPKLGVVTANELHIPISDPSKPTPTYLEMSSADTDHSFWVPRLAGKMDLIPNRVNTMWIDPRSPVFILANARSTVGRNTPRCCCASTPSRRKTSPPGSSSNRDRRSRIFRATRSRRRADGLHAQRLHQLPHDRGNGSDRTFRTGPDPPGQPRHDCLRPDSEHTRESEKVDRRSELDEARCR